MKKTLMIAALALSGCVFDPATPVIDAQLNAMQGQPSGNVFYRLGYPTGQSMVANTKFYYWSTSGVIMQPTIYDTSGFAQVGHKTVSYDQTTFGPDRAIPVGCTIRVFVDPSERVVAHDISGDQTGCKPYALRLDPTYNPRAHFM